MRGLVKELCGNIKDRKTSCNDIILEIDHLWDVFKGNINIFSLFLLFLVTMFNFSIWISGLFSWYKEFSFQTIEVFFYLYFIVTNFLLINHIILHVVQNDSFQQIILELSIKSIIGFYSLSVVYSFLIFQEKNYRSQWRNSERLLKYSKVSYGDTLSSIN